MLHSVLKISFVFKIDLGVQNVYLYTIVCLAHCYTTIAEKLARTRNYWNDL